jgi:hypothetical protein
LYTIYNLDGSVLRTFQGRFSLATDSSQWKVNYVDLRNKTEQETTFDGNTTYTLFKNLPLANFDLNTLYPDKVIESNGQRYLDVETAGVDTYVEPVSLPADARVAWLSLPAAGLLSNPPRQLIPPWSVAASPGAFAYESIYDLTPNQDSFARIQFISSQKLWTASNKGPVSRDQLDVPEKEFLEGTFRLTGWTNVDGKVIPLKSEFIRFWFPTKKALRPERFVITSQVTNYYYSTDPIKLPALSKKTYVTDTRFKTETAPDFTANYVATPPIWFAKDDPRLVPWVAESMTTYLKTKKLVKAQQRLR